MKYSELTTRLTSLANETRHGVDPEGGFDSGMKAARLGDRTSDWTTGLAKADAMANRQTERPWLNIDSGFGFGKKSKHEMKGVMPGLLNVATLALKFSTQDFMFFDGLRTEAEQRAYVNAGTSKTMMSKHRKQASGFAEAMDLVPVVGILPKWDWQLIYPIVAAVDAAATDLGVANKIVWGGAWDRRLSDFGGDVSLYEKECRDYAARHPGKDFLDGPHFECRA